MRPMSTKWLWVLCGCMAVSACQAILYDAQADQQITSLGQEVNQQLLTWEFDEARQPGSAAYDPKYYAKVESDLTMLQMRINAGSGSNEAVLPDVFSTMQKLLDDEQAAHSSQSRKVDGAFFHVERGLWNTQLATLTSYELALKQSGQAQSASGADARAKGGQESSKTK